MSDGMGKRSVNVGHASVWLIWAVFFAPLVFSVVFANVLGGQRTVTGGAPDDVFSLAKYILYGITVVLLVLIFLLRRAFHKPDSVVNRLMHSWSVVARQTVLTVVAGGLCQAIGVYGLICFLLDGDFVSLYVLAGTAAATLVFLRPRRQDLVGLAAQSKSDS